MVSLTNLTRSRVPRLPWNKAAQGILGSQFEVSLVFAGEKYMAELKCKYPPYGYSKVLARDGRATSVLSFLISAREGEIFLCPRFIKREAHFFERSYLEHLFALYIHGLLHLKGLDHDNSYAAAKMENREREYFDKFYNF